MVLSKLADPHLSVGEIAHLAGFADAGNAVTLAARHLRDSLESELVATFRADELIDYRSRRPVMDFSGQAFTGIEMPSLTVHAIRDNAGQPFLLLSGAEPDLRWEQFTAAVRGLSDRKSTRLNSSH